jgi:hypothetical protein
LGSVKWEICGPGCLGKKEKKRYPISKITRGKKVEDMAQVIEHLPTKGETLNSNPCTIKKNCDRIILKYFQNLVKT